MKKTSLISGIIIGLSMVTVAIAAPPGSPFNLGETLDPACAPGDPNCTVVTPAASGDNTDITSLGSGNIGIGTTSPIEKLSLEGDGVDADVSLRIYEDVTSENPTIFMDFAEGTLAAPSNVSSGQTVGQMVGRSYAGAGFEDIATMNFVVDDSTGAGDHSGRVDFFTATDKDGGPDSALVRRLEIGDDEVTINPDTYDGDGEDFNIGESQDEPGSTSSDTAISMENNSFVYEIHVEDSNEFVIYEGNSENSTDSVLMYDGATNNWGFGTDPSGAQITMDNGATLSAGGVWTDASSRELKENISELSLEDALRALKGLQPVSFNYLEEKDEEYLGFIAEDVPDLVAKNDRKGLAPMDIVAVLTKVIQDQEERILALEEQLKK